MKMKVRASLLLLTSLFAVVPGYGKKWWNYEKRGAGESWSSRASGGKRYVAPQDFVDRYVRDDIKRRLGDFTEKWGFVDVKLTDVQSELEAGFGMPIEKITCRVTLVPKDGVEFYMPVPWTAFGKEERSDISHLLNGVLTSKGVMTNVLPSAWIATAEQRRDEVRTALHNRLSFNVFKVPIGVPIKDFTEMFTATVYRAKDGEGVYRPVKKNGIQSEMVKYSSRSRCNFTCGGGPKDPFGDSLMTGERLRELGGVPSTNDGDVHAVRSAFATNVLEFAEAFSSLAKAEKEYEAVVGDGNGSRFVRNKLKELRCRKLISAQQGAESEINKTQEVTVLQQAEKARLESVIRTAAEKLDRAWQAMALPSRPVHW